jgi:NADPH:quinone reductase-like Zn-dependent oxidoreductase
MVARKPRKLSFAEAAAIPLAGLTAYQALTEALGVVRHETLLVTAAAGGVGHFAVQIARHLGADVVGTAGTAIRSSSAASAPSPWTMRPAT